MVLIEEPCEELPQHLVYSILLRLPTKSLLRFLCLSKQFCEIIQSRSFSLERWIVQQSGTSVENQTVGYIIIQWYHEEGDQVLPVTLQRLWGCGHGFNTSECLRLKVPFGENFLVGIGNNLSLGDQFYASEFSCDGLLCVVYRSIDTPSKSRIFLWNPHTDKYRGLAWPDEFMSDYIDQCFFVGFGYDSDINDYKIVVMKTPTRTTSCKVQIFVTYLKSYNNKKSTWREVDLSATWSSLSINLVHTQQCYDPVTVKGDIYWLGNDPVSKSFHILKFNIANEMLMVVPLPSEIIEALKVCEPQVWWRIHIELSHVNNKSLYLNYYNNYFRSEPGSIPLEVWRYTSKGFKKVLTKHGIGEMSRMNPHAFTNNGDFIISCEYGSFVAAYNPQRDELKVVESRGRPVSWALSSAFVDMESLIAP